MVGGGVWFSWGVFLYVLVLIGWSATELLRFRSSGSLLESLVASAFLPEKRRRYLSLLTTEGVFLMLSALVWGLAAVGAVPAAVGGVLLPLLLAGGVTALTALTNLGLRPPRLTEAERRELAREMPEVLRSLAFLPVSARGFEEQPGPRGPD